MIDLLKMLYRDEISLDEAYDLKDEAVDKLHKGEIKDWVSYLGLNVWEVGSNANVVGLRNLAKLRYQGWAKNCDRCGRRIIKEKGGWWFDMDENGNPLLRHLSCEDDYLRKVYGEDFLERESER